MSSTTCSRRASSGTRCPGARSTTPPILPPSATATSASGTVAATARRGSAGCASSTALRISGPRSTGESSSENVPRSSSDEGDHLVYEAHQLVERGLELPEELVALGLGDVRVAQHVRDPLRHRDRGPELVGDVGQEVTLGRRPLRHVALDAFQLVLKLADAQDGRGQVLPEPVRRSRGQRHPAVEHGPHRRQDRRAPLERQQVGVGACREHLGDLRAVGAPAPHQDPARGRRRRGTAVISSGRGHAGEVHLDDDHVGT